jgi:hypothetical protein
VKEARHKKVAYCMIPLYQIFRINKSIEVAKTVVAKGWGRGEWGMIPEGCGVSFRGDKKL